MTAQFKRYVASLLTTIAVGITLDAKALDGDAGESSSGTSQLDLLVPKLVKITNIGAIDFGRYSGVGNLSQSDPVCIYSNMDTNNVGNDYTVTMHGNGTAGTGGCTSNCFTLTCQGGDCLNGASPDDQIVYNAYWDTSNEAEAQIGTEGGVEASEDGWTGWSNLDDCGGGGATNATFRVRIDEQDILDDKRAGTYQGVLTIVITPTVATP